MFDKSPKHPAGSLKDIAPLENGPTLNQLMTHTPGISYNDEIGSPRESALSISVRRLTEDIVNELTNTW